MAWEEVLALPRRILVTGGSGFIGSHLTARLLDMGHSVVVVDNYFSGREDNLSGLKRDDRLTVIQADVSEDLSMDADQIFHLACPASPVYYQRDPVQTLKTCVQGSINVLELARRTGARVVLASTSEVYGDPLVHPQDEDYWGNVNPIGPRSCYDEGKRCAEALFAAYRRQHGVDTKIVRIFNTYGPRMRQDDGRVISNFIVNALRGEPLEVSGDGLQTRSFCFVDDLVDGLIRVMATGTEYPGPVNIGNPHEVTIKDLAARILQLTGGVSDLVHRPDVTDDPKRRRPDIRRAERDLGWTPTTDLDAGLRRTVDYFRSILVG